MHLNSHSLLLCAWVMVVHAGIILAENPRPATPTAELLFPDLVFEVGDDGSLQRRFTELRCADMGHIWGRMLKEASVRRQLELLGYQERDLLAAARSAARSPGGDPAKYRAAVQSILLPHQLDELKQLIGRYRCLASGVMRQLEASEAFPTTSLTPNEIQRVGNSLAKLTKKYHATSERELRVFDIEVRKGMTRGQLEAVHSLIGERKVLHGPFLDFAILRLETVADRRPNRLNLGLKESAAVLGRSTHYRLTISGQLQPTRSDTPIDFFAAFRNGIDRAGLSLNAEQQDLLADFEKNLVAEVSRESKRVYRLLTEEKLAIAEAKDILNSIAKRQINRTLSIFDAVMSRQQQNRIDEYVFQRDLAQRGMLPILVEGRRIPISDDQKQALLDIIERKLKRFRELTHEVETEIWDAVKYGLSAGHRISWTEAYGDGVLDSLPVSPALLLFRSTSVE